MKNFLLFAFIFCAFNIFAQDFSVEPNPVHEWEVEDSEEIRGDAIIKNNSTVTKMYTWERTVISETNNTATWFCDPNLCYTPSVSTQQFSLEPGQEGDFQLHAAFSDPDVRALKVQIKVYENGNEANVIDAIYELELMQVGVETVDLSEIKLFPNPTSDNFTLTNVDRIQDVIIHNIIGTPLKQYLAENNADYYIGDLPAGIYMVELIDVDGNNVGTKRVFKQ